jgi:hypothetical protein
MYAFILGAIFMALVQHYADHHPPADEPEKPVIEESIDE